MHPTIPLVACLVYIFMVRTYSPSKATVLEKQRQQEMQHKASVSITSFNKWCACHNLVLCIYSAVSFVGSCCALYDDYEALGWKGLFCGSFGASKWVYLFHLSKYYEFVDTMIVILKNNRPSFLQTYHHVGAVIVTYSFVVSTPGCCWLFVILNSLVHTVMYLYYFFTCLKIYCPFKHVITTIQLTQFVAGMMLGIPAWHFNECLTFERIVALASTYVYTMALIPLFLNFYRSSYFPNKPKKQPTTATNNVKKAI